MTKEKVIDILKGIKDGTAWLMPNIAEDGEKAIDIAIKAVEHPEPHWIPVTKDTPKEANTYMCTCSDAGRRIVTPVKWQPRTKTWNLTRAKAYWKVIAWMPMPAPWKGE